MKYYVIQISEGDSKISGKSIYEYTDRTSALGSYHTKLGQAMNSELFTSTQIICIDENNGILAMDKFVREVASEEVTEE